MQRPRTLFPKIGRYSEKLVPKAHFSRKLLQRKLLQPDERGEVKLTEHDDADEGDGAHDLDEDIEGRPDGIFEGVADGIADDGGVMSGGAFSAALHAARLDVFFGVVPGAARVARIQGEHNGGDGRAEEDTAHEVSAEQETADDGECDGDDGGQDHFFERTLRGDGDAGLIVGFFRSREDAGALRELSAHFLDHIACGFGDGIDEHSAEEEGKGGADDGADEHIAREEV